LQLGGTVDHADHQSCSAIQGKARRVPRAARAARTAPAGNPLAWTLRKGSAGSHTAADHIAVTEAAIAALPPAYRRNLMITWDAFTGAAADDLNGWDITAAVAEVQPGQP
jgi:hypothetical protein